MGLPVPRLWMEQPAGAPSFSVSWGCAPATAAQSKVPTTPRGPAALQEARKIPLAPPGAHGDCWGHPVLRG